MFLFHASELCHANLTEKCFLWISEKNQANSVHDFFFSVLVNQFKLAHSF